MDTNAAKEILGLEGQITPKRVKEAYRKAAAANHPDRGGSTTKMKAVNEAYEFLGKLAVVEISRMSWRERSAQLKEEAAFASSVLGSIVESMDVEGYSDRLKAIFGAEVTPTIKTATQTYGASCVITWLSVDRDSAYELYLYLDSQTIRKLGASLSNGDSFDIELTSKTTLFHAGRDVKVTQSRWLSANPTSGIYRIDEMLPLAKTLKAIEKAQSRATKRLDIVGFLRLCAGFSCFAKGAEDTFQIKKGNALIQITRSSSLKMLGGVSGSLFVDRKYATSIYSVGEREGMMTKELRSLVVQYQDCTTTNDIKALSGKILEVGLASEKETKAA